MAFSTNTGTPPENELQCSGVCIRIPVVTSEGPRVLHRPSETLVSDSIPQREYQRTVWFPMVSKWCRIWSIHSMYIYIAPLDPGFHWFQTGATWISQPSTGVQSNGREKNFSWRLSSARSPGASGLRRAKEIQPETGAWGGGFVGRAFNFFKVEFKGKPT